jgi:hypothetical protein
MFISSLCSCNLFGAISMGTTQWTSILYTGELYSVIYCIDLCSLSVWRLCCLPVAQNLFPRSGHDTRVMRVHTRGWYHVHRLILNRRCMVDTAEHERLPIQWTLRGVLSSTRGCYKKSRGSPRRVVRSSDGILMHCVDYKHTCEDICIAFRPTRALLRRLKRCLITEG